MHRCSASFGMLLHNILQSLLLLIVFPIWQRLLICCCISCSSPSFVLKILFFGWHLHIGDMLRRTILIRKNKTLSSFSNWKWFYSIQNRKKTERCKKLTSLGDFRGKALPPVGITDGSEGRWNSKWATDRSIGLVSVSKSKKPPLLLKPKSTVRKFEITP